jgi:glycerol-3-phosphate dehydrogenase
MKNRHRVCVVGNGGWGTALALLLFENGNELIRNRFSGARTPARLPVRVRTQTG